MGDSKRTVDLIWSEMEALTADPDFDPAKYAELEAERNTVLARGQATQRHGTYSLVAPGQITATPKGDDGQMYAFAQYLKTGQPNSDLTFAQTEGTASAGGYGVPDGARSKLIEARTAFGGFINLTDEITTDSGNDIHYPTIPTAALYSSADIAAEGAATAAGADWVESEVVLGAYRYVAAGTGNVGLKLSLELIQDSVFDVVAFTMKRLGERIARRQAYDVIRGSGSGEPQGIAYGTAGSYESDPTGFAVFNHLVHLLDPVYRANASWVFNDATLETIEGLLDGPSGTSGRPIMTYGVGAEDVASHGRLLGYPIHIVQEMPTWAADDVIGAGFGDWREAYVVRHVKDVTVLVNPFIATGYVGYDAYARMDGKVQNASAYVTGEGV